MHAPKVSRSRHVTSRTSNSQHSLIIVHIKSVNREDHLMRPKIEQNRIESKSEYSMPAYIFLLVEGCHVWLQNHRLLIQLQQLEK